MTAAEFEAAGLYDPKAPNAADRLELLEWLAARGVTVEQMVRAARTIGHSLSGLAGDLALRPGERYTLAQVAERAGVPIERVRQLNLAAGLPPTPPAAPVFTDDDVLLFGGFAGRAALFGEAPVLRFVRTVGSSLARIAEAAVSLFLVNVEGPMLQHGDERARARGGEPARDRVARRGRGDAPEPLPDAHGGGDHAPPGRPPRAIDRHDLLTIGFVDLVGFTTLSRRMSARELAAVVERFEETAHDVVTTRGGRVVKLIGDEVMFVALDAAAACDIALALVEHFASDASVTPRGGLATGELVIRGGDYYGPIVNLAARMAELAVPHELLVTPEVVAPARQPGSASSRRASACSRASTSPSRSSPSNARRTG